MFNQTKYNLLIQSIKHHFNYNDKEALRLVYHTSHNLLMDALVKKYNVSHMEAQFLISVYNLEHNVLF